jgi:hypothetical protein
MRDIQHLIGQGLSAEEMAEQLGVTVKHVRKLLRHQPHTPKPPRIEFPPAGHCVFPIGHLPTLEFCGSKVELLGIPYCRECCARAYQHSPMK